MRPSWVEIDLEAVRANTAAMVSDVAPAVVCAVVKADAYGHGDVPVARAVLEGGAAWLAVALVEEGVGLREAGIDAPILLLSEPPAGDVAEIIEWNLTPTVYREPFARALAGAALDAPLPVHLKVNTGMHRVGIDRNGAEALARYVATEPRLALQGLWTHFPVAEEDAGFTKAQVAELLDMRDLLAAEGIDVPIVHAANSAGALGYDDARLDMVRVGLALFGLRPAPGFGHRVELRPAMRVVSHVTMTRFLPAGARPSYGRRRPLPAAGRVATVPIGYADGLFRALSRAGGEVLIRGRRYPYAGTVTMDQVVVDVGADPVEEGDEVVVLGAQGGEEITADEWAELLETINYEIVCAFGPRLPRRYLG